MQDEIEVATPFCEGGIKYPIEKLHNSVELVACPGCNIKSYPVVKKFIEKGIPLYSQEIDTECGVILKEEKGAIPTMHYFRYDLVGCLQPSDLDESGVLLPDVDISNLETEVIRQEFYENNISDATSDQIKE